MAVGAPENAPHGAPVVRLLSVRDVAAALSVSRATAYSLVKAGELVRVWIGASNRVPAEVARFSPTWSAAVGEARSDRSATAG